MSYGSGVEILSPRKARDYMKAQFEEALKQYQRDEKWNDLFKNKPAHAYDTMINLAEERFNIQKRKKSGTKQ